MEFVAGADARLVPAAELRGVALTGPVTPISAGGRRLVATHIRLTSLSLFSPEAVQTTGPQNVPIRSHERSECAQIRRKLAASGPFLPSTTSTATRWPSARSVMPARLSTVVCTKISLPPRSDPMKPNPLALYHLIVPISSTTAWLAGG